MHLGCLCELGRQDMGRMSWRHGRGGGWFGFAGQVGVWEGDGQQGVLTGVSIKTGYYLFGLGLCGLGSWVVYWTGSDFGLCWFK